MSSLRGGAELHFEMPSNPGSQPSEPKLFSLRQESGATIVDLQLDNLLALADLNRLAPALLSVAEKAAGQKLVLDLSLVRYAGSAALGLLLKLDSQLKRAGGRLVLVINDVIEGLLRVSRTRNLFAIAPDIAAAVTMS